MATRMTDGGGTAGRKQYVKSLKRAENVRAIPREKRVLHKVERSTGSAYGDKMRADWNRKEEKKEAVRSLGKTLKNNSPGMEPAYNAIIKAFQEHEKKNKR